MNVPDVYKEANEAGGFYDETDVWHTGLFAPDGTFYPGYYDENYNWVDLEETAPITYNSDAANSDQSFAYINPYGEGGSAEGSTHNPLTDNQV